MIISSLLLYIKLESEASYHDDKLQFNEPDFKKVLIDHMAELE